MGKKDLFWHCFLSSFCFVIGTMTASTPDMPWISQEWAYIFFHLICPCMGCLVATATFAAPIADLRLALLRQSLGDLNPRPWAVMTGNCLGWCAYAYYIHNPFILASNIPGLILSMWLNAGAAKLEYRQMTATHHSSSTSGMGGESHRPTVLLNAHEPNEESEPIDCVVVQVPFSPVFTPQEIWWLRVLILWSVILVWVGWLFPGPNAPTTVGILVNLNLIFFYAAPLQTIRHVLQSGNSNSIHGPTMMMVCANASFWFLYGVALGDPIVMLPNAIGLTLGLVQVALRVIYPHTNTTMMRPTWNHQGESSIHSQSEGISMTRSHSTNSQQQQQSQSQSHGIFRDLTLSTNTPQEDLSTHSS